MDADSNFVKRVPKRESTLGGGHNAPPHADTLFQIPCGIGLRGFLKSLGDFKENLIFPNLVVHK